MKKTGPLSMILILVSLMVAGYAGYIQLTNYLRIRSVNECMQNAKVELQSNVQIGQTNYVTTRTQPIGEWFDRCMQEKGYR